MSDLVERLRECAHRAKMHYFDAPIYNEAADEIERLEKENAELKSIIKASIANTPAEAPEDDE